MTGDRPPRPENARLLRDQIWNMIVKCWSEQREQRWDIRSVYNQLSVASIQEIAEGERGNKHPPCQTAVHAEEAVPFSELQTRAPVLNVVGNSPLPPLPNPRTRPRQSTAGDRLSIFVEGKLDVCSKPSPANRHVTPCRTRPLRLPNSHKSIKSQGQIGQT